MIALYFLATVLLECSISADAKLKNVLFLVSDDMRPDIGAYQGPDFPAPADPKMHTPNLDGLASKSLLMKRAYVQEAVCSPSRTSLLTGRRPDTTRVHDLTLYWRQVAGNFTTIPQYFKEHGYRTFGMGKIFHPGRASGEDDPISWNEPYFRPKGSHWTLQRDYTWFAANDEETQKYPLVDMQTASNAVKVLQNLADEKQSDDRPFFVAVGFHKPHLPFLFPARFLNYYPEEDIKLPTNPYAPVNMPEIAWSNFDELRHYKDIKDKYGYGAINTTLSDAKVKELRRAYYAALSYTDSLVGEVMAKLDSLGIANETVVSFWGDHGWQLGEHGEWCKHTNFELATHAPMMVHVPGLTDKGLVTERLTEFVDLFPTLAEAAGLPPVPLCPPDSRKVETCTEGVSVVPLMHDPSRNWKTGSFSQYPRTLCDGDTIMGYRIRTPTHSYTEWVLYDVYNSEPIWDNVKGVDLYDHVWDPQENINVVSHPEYKNIRQQLHKQLRAGWRAALPPKVTHEHGDPTLLAQVVNANKFDHL